MKPTAITVKLAVSGRGGTLTMPQVQDVARQILEGLPTPETAAGPVVVTVKSITLTRP